MSTVSVELKLNNKTLLEIEELPDKVLYKMARMTLDYSNTIIPMSRGLKTSGQLRRDSMAYGVRGSNGDYYIGSPTRYASHVWNLPAIGTNWTTPNTTSKWFEVALKRHKATIVDNSIEQAKKESNL